MTGQTSPDFSSSSSPMDFHEEGSTPNNMKSKVRANALYNTPRARRFTERVAEAVEVSSLGRSMDEGMVLDSPSPVRYEEDVDMTDPSSSPLQLRNNKTIRKRRSIINKNTEAQQRQRRKLRHTQQLQQQQQQQQKISRGSDDEYEDEDGEDESDDEYLQSNNTNTGRSSRRSVVASANNNHNLSRQSSVGSEEGGNNNNNSAPAATPTRMTTTGRRRRLRLQNTNNTTLDTPEIDEDASPTFFPTKTSRSMSPVIVEPIVLGTTNGVNKNRRRRHDPIAEKLDRLRHAPDVNMLDLSQHLIIPDNNTMNNNNNNIRDASPSSSISTTGSNSHHQEQQQQQQQQQQHEKDRSTQHNGNEQDEKDNQSNSGDDREESPISIPERDGDEVDEDGDEDDDIDMEQIFQEEEGETLEKNQEHETVISSAITTEQEHRHVSNDNVQESPSLEDSNPIDTQEQVVSSPMIPDTTIELPSSPITPQPMTMRENTNNNSNNNNNLSKSIFAENDDTNITINQQEQELKQESTSIATESEMELLTGEQQQVTPLHPINENDTNIKDIKSEGDEKGHDKQNTYFGRVVGSVSRFFWGA